MPVYAQLDVLPRLTTTMPALTDATRCEWPVLITAISRGDEWLPIGNGDAPAIKFYDLEELSMALATMMSTGYRSFRLTFSEPNGSVRQRELRAWEMGPDARAIRDLGDVIERLVHVRREHENTLLPSKLLKAEMQLIAVRMAWIEGGEDMGFVGTPTPPPLVVDGPRQYKKRAENVAALIRRAYDAEKAKGDDSDLGKLNRLAHAMNEIHALRPAPASLWDDGDLDEQHEAERKL